MAQWDVHDNPSVRSREVLPYVVVVQSDLLSGLDTRLVVPLARRMPGRAGATSRLSPTMQVRGDTLYVVAQECAPVFARTLSKPVASLRADAHRIVDALDAVISGV